MENLKKMVIQRILAMAIIGVISVPPLSLAGVITDGTVGPGTILSGPDYQISDSLGTTVGPNLFHSFHAFSIDHRESATFSGPETIQNVMSRITGGEVSTIDGLLRSEIGQAAFYFINPAGIVFGENAQVDVPAAFHVSSADGLYFADGSVFSAVSPDISTLSMSQPESLGFLSAQPARIEVNGAVLEFTAESTVSLSSGDITIQGPGAALRNPGGEISLTALGRATGVVALAENLPSTVGGTLLLDSAVVESSGDGGGHIVVHAGTVSMDGATVAADNSGDSPASGGIDLLVDGTLSVSHGSRVQSSVWAAGDSGGIRVEAENVLIEQQDYDTFTGFFTEVEAAATGNAGTIDIQVMDEMRIQGVGGISSATYGTGDAGSVLVSAGDLLIDGEGRSAPYRAETYFAGISSEADFHSIGNAGTVSVTVEKKLSLLNGCGLDSYSSGTGTAGSVLVNAGELTIDGGENGNFTAIVSNANSGFEDNGKAVDVTVDSLLELINGGQIIGDTPAIGDAGSVTVGAGTVKIDGRGWFTGIESTAYSGSEGDAGTVKVTVDGLLELMNGASISSSSWAVGDAGSVAVNAEELTMDGQGNVYQLTGIVSNAYPGSQGTAGTVEITVDGLLELINGAEVSSSTWATGDGGSVIVKAGELKLDNLGNVDQFTVIASNANAGSEGNGGTVEITVAGLLELRHGARISSSTWAPGDAGRVKVVAGELQIDAQGNSEQFTGIASSASSDSEGDAGTVEISVAGLLELMSGAEISSNTFSTGDAGSVIVTAGELKIDTLGADLFTGIASQATNGSEGAAGTVEITVAGLLELINGAAISSSTWSQGDAGRVVVSAGELTVANQGNSEQFTGIASTANSGSGGDAGSVEITVEGLLELTNGAEVSSGTFAGGDAGSVIVSAGELTVDNQGNTEQFTGIASTANSGSGGDAGSVEITVDGLLELINGAEISSGTFARGDAGSVTVSAGELTVDSQGNSEQFTGITSNTSWDSEGDAGTVKITVFGLLELIHGAEISSSTSSPGNAGSVIVSAGELKIDDQGNTELFTGVMSNADIGSEGNAGIVEITVDGLLELTNGAAISSSTWSSGDAGSVIVTAGELKIDNWGNTEQVTGIMSSANSGSEGNGGTVEITVSGLLELIKGAQISSSTSASGDGGSVTVQAGQMKIDTHGSEQFTGIGSQATTGSEGNGGTVQITVAGLLELINGAEISSGTFARGDGGSVRVNVGQLKIDDQGKEGRFTGIASTADSGSEGNAGTVEITVAGLLELVAGAQISSSTWARGNAGRVKVDAGEVKIDNQGSTEQFTGVMSNAYFGSEGNADTVEIGVAGLLELINGATISSSTWSTGDAGSVIVKAGELQIDAHGVEPFTGIASQATISSEGSAGTVEITVAGLLELINGGQITSSTWAPGDAGSVTIKTETLKIDGQGNKDKLTGIGSTAEPGSGGTAGTVEITVGGLLELLDGAEISSGTSAPGDAGSVIVNAQKMSINGEFTGIFSGATDTATGYVGDVIINSDLISLVNGGQISISADQVLAEDRLAHMEQNAICISSHTLHLDQHAKITAESTANVPAGAINIQADNTLIENSSRITTSSNDANGGPITVQGDVIFLNEGLMSTSVGGSSGDGGDITIMGISTDEPAVPASFLMLKGGFIQANTGAEQASGGDIYLDAGNIIAANNLLEVGGSERHQFTADTGLNIIQAAAPGGEQGLINLRATQLDLSGSLESLDSNLTEPVTLATDPCKLTGKEEASSLLFSSGIE